MEQRKRNSNIELLRVLSMSMVLVLHGLMQSGALEYRSGIHYWVYWGLEAACYCAVNMFVLISGYFQINARFKTRSVVRVAFTSVWLYSVIFSLLQMALAEQPGSRMEILRAVFPLMTNKFWFVNCYVFLYLISPYLNKALRALNRRQLTALIITLMVVVSVRSTAFPISWTQVADGGSGIVWFVTLYCVAAWLRLCGIQRIKAWMGVAVYLLATAGMVVIKWLLLLLGLGAYSGKLYSYSSVFVLAQAIGLFVAFLKSKPVDTKYEKIIALAGKHSFSVYIIHFAMWGVLFTTILGLDKYIDNPLIGILAILAATVVIYIFCVLVDMAKSWLECKACACFLSTKAGRKYISMTEEIDDLVNGQE